MTTMNPWMSPHHLALQQQEHFITNDYHSAYYTIPSYAHYHQLQAQYQHQHQYRQRHRHQQYYSSTQGPSSAKQTRSSANEKHHNYKVKSASTASNTHRRLQSPSISESTSQVTHPSKKERGHPQSSLSSPSSSLSSLSSHTERASKQYLSQQQQRRQHQHQQLQLRSNSPVPSLLDDTETRRSSIQSHASAASSSIKTASDSSFAYNCSVQSSSTSIFSMSTTVNSKPSLSKRLRGVLTGGGNKQHYTSSSERPVLGRSPSSVSCASSLVSNATMTTASSRSSWTNLFRRSSANQKTSPMHAKHSSAQKGNQ